MVHTTVPGSNYIMYMHQNLMLWTLSILTDRFWFNFNSVSVYKLSIELLNNNHDDITVACISCVSNEREREQPYHSHRLP